MAKNKNGRNNVANNGKGNPQDGTRKSTDRIEQQKAAMQRKKAVKAAKEAAKANNSNSNNANDTPAYFVKNGETDLKKILIAERKAEIPAIKAKAREIQSRIKNGEAISPEDLKIFMRAKAIIQAEREAEAIAAKAQAEAEAAAKAQAEAEAAEAKVTKKEIAKAKIALTISKIVKADAEAKADRNKRVQARKAERREALAGGDSDLFNFDI